LNHWFIFYTVIVVSRAGLPGVVYTVIEEHKKMLISNCSV